MKIYTRSGDQGHTGLLSGERVSKSDLRVEACGSVDELNAILGVLIADLSDDQSTLASELQQIQSDLFIVGGWLSATPNSSAVERLRPLTAQHVERLEQSIDRMQAELPSLTVFILPGGHRSAAWAHWARTVCRRAERRIVSLTETAEGYQCAPYRQLVAYINRLADYLFVLARTLNRLAGIADVEWRK